MSPIDQLDEYSLLAARIEYLREEVGRAEHIFSNAGIDPQLRHRVEIPFEKLFEDQRRQLDAIRLDPSDKQSFAECLKKFESIRQACTPLFRECLALVQGALSRAAGLDDGLCVIADHLLDDLSRLVNIHWGRFTILAEGESYVDMAQVIRLRFPGFNIWNLPLVAHEFGHFVARELRHKNIDGTYSYPIVAYAKKESRSHPAEEKYIPERFADLFAIYSLGPAFACACVLLPFDPSTATEAGQTHPSEAERVYSMLKALELTDVPANVWNYHGVIQSLKGTWQPSLVAAGSKPDLDDDTKKLLDVRTEFMYGRLLEEAPTARYQSWSAAVNLATQLGSDRDTIVPPGASVADVLNGAWLWRVNHWNESPSRVGRIGAAAMEASLKIMSWT